MTGIIPHLAGFAIGRMDNFRRRRLDIPAAGSASVQSAGAGWALIVSAAKVATEVAKVQ
jgi:hypothetical protein